MNQHHDKQTIDAAQATAIQLQDQAPGMSRRKFLTRTGVGSLPVIMSLQSGSAWGCVDLECKSGKTSMSNSGSAVASATTNAGGKQAAYERPQWSKVSVVKKVLKEDFDKYLLSTYNTELFKEGYNQGQLEYRPVSKSSYGEWWTQVKGKCFTRSSVQKWNKATKRYEAHWKYTQFYGERRKPAVYGDLDGLSPQSGIMLLSSTTFSEIFGDGPSTSFESCLNQFGSLEMYLVAAFIGSVWERHPVYTNQFQGRPICYPPPDELVSAYAKAKVRHKGMDDLKSLLELYTIDG